MIEQNKEVLEVEQQEFYLWLDDPVTKVMFSYIKNCVENVKVKRLSPSYLKDEHGLLKLNELYGYEKALLEILNLETNIVEDENEEIEIKSSDVENNSKNRE